MVETKAFKTYNKRHSLLEIGPLRTNIKLTLYKALIRSLSHSKSRNLTTVKCTTDQVTKLLL
jgi:hypothetical protein